MRSFGILSTRVLIPFAMGVAIYVALFAFGLEKPLTVGVTGDYLERKTRYLAGHQTERKVVIFAGSNGRFSHRCETVESVLGMPCSNMSIAAGSSFSWQISKVQPFLKANDIVYLPLEYKFKDRSGAIVGNEAPYLVRYDRPGLRFYDKSQSIAAHFYFDLRFAVGAVVEMLLDSGGIKRRFSTDTMTSQGDESGHTPTRGEGFRARLVSEKPPLVERQMYEATADWEGELGFLSWARERGVIVVGGLPTVFEDTAVPDQVVSFLRSLYRDAGHCFLVLDNLGKYPRSHFYDNGYHLSEPNQIEHSRRIAFALRTVAQSGCAALQVASDG